MYMEVLCSEFRKALYAEEEDVQGVPEFLFHSVGRKRV
jgi:hypothetical protein